jgi:dipeptidyl aminopeptidase/acylaminoacyl peptidase
MHSLGRIAALAILVASGGAVAQPTAVAADKPLTVEDFVRLPAYSNPVISRNGRYFAVTIPINGRLNLAVVDLENRQGTGLTNFSECDVLNPRWVGNDRLVFTLGQTNTPTGPGTFDCGGLFMVGRDGKSFQRLAETVRDARRQNRRYRSLVFLSTIPNNDEEILAAGNLRDAESVDLYRLNITNGRSTLITPTRPTRTQDWLLDRNRVPRVVTSWVKDTTTQIVHYRKDENSPWEEIARYEWTEPNKFYPLSFEADNQVLHVAMNAGRETLGVYRYDPNQRKVLGPVYEHPKFDMAGQGGGRVITDPVTDELLGYRVEGERPQTFWLAERERRTQAMVDGALPGRFNEVRRMRGDQHLVTSYSDVEPTTWFILDEGKRTLEELFASRPWLSGGRMVEMRPFFLKTRDGLEILSYYFLPKNHKPGEKLPTVVHIHGGPAVRADYWGRLGFGVIEAQVLASRGYAVVVPNFRITPGLGNRVYYGGFGTMGRQMIEDHEDAARWAVAQGFADPERICISGASYGGYATLMALARFPQTFRCGVAGLVVSDWSLLMTSPATDLASSPAAVIQVNRMIGADSPSRYPADIQPVNLAEQIKNPLMFYAGADDIRTPLEQTTRMIRALERAGNPPKSVVIVPGEGHGFGRVENNVTLYSAMLKFLDEQIGPGSRR